jgi:hypothetical protein
VTHPTPDHQRTEAMRDDREPDPQGFVTWDLPKQGVQPVEAQSEPVAWLCCGSLFHSYDAITSSMLPPMGRPVPLYTRSSGVDSPDGTKQ